MRNRISQMHSSDFSRCRTACGLSPDEARIMDMSDTRQVMLRWRLLSMSQPQQSLERNDLSTPK